MVAQQFQWSFRYAGKDGKFGPTGLKFVSDSDLVGVDRKNPDGKDDIVSTGVLTVDRVNGRVSRFWLDTARTRNLAFSREI